MNRSNGNGIMAGLVSAFLLGAATAMLVAPNSGKENRKVLGNQISNIKDRMGRNKGVQDMDVEGMLSRSTRADYLH